MVRQRRIVDEPFQLELRAVDEGIESSSRTYGCWDNTGYEVSFPSLRLLPRLMLANSLQMLIAICRTRKCSEGPLDYIGRKDESADVGVPEDCPGRYRSDQP